MGEKPLKTLNLIGKLMSASSSNASSSMSSAAEDHQQLRAAATADLTLQPPPSNVNKRKAEGDLVAEHDDDDDQSRPRLTTGASRSSYHRVHDHVQQVVGDPALYEIKKKLKQSDVGHLSRLLVPKEMVKNHILPFVDDEFVHRVESRDGAFVTVLDNDSKTNHQLTFRYFNSSKSYVFNGDWNKAFVNRRELKEDDEIGLHWNSGESKFHFSRLKLATQQSRGAN